MNIIKEAGVSTAAQVSPEDLALINAQSRKELTAKEVFTFCVRLCDNEVDREYDRFPEATLQGLAPLFVGKSGIFDHRWSAREQVGRIYRTELVREEQIRTAAGDPYCYLKGWVYMVRTDSNRDLIAEIEGGIKREVSVGCSVERSICSICGEDLSDRSRCAHVKGRVYNGKLCWAELEGATDAYEWSFVAVPAQREAGVLKGFHGLRELAGKEPCGAVWCVWVDWRSPPWRLPPWSALFSAWKRGSWRPSRGPMRSGWRVSTPAVLSCATTDPLPVPTGAMRCSVFKR